MWSLKACSIFFVSLVGDGTIIEYNDNCSTKQNKYLAGPMSVNPEQTSTDHCAQATGDNCLEPKACLGLWIFSDLQRTQLFSAD